MALWTSDIPVTREQMADWRAGRPLTDEVRQIIQQQLGDPNSALMRYFDRVEESQRKLDRREYRWDLLFEGLVLEEQERAKNIVPPPSRN